MKGRVSKNNTYEGIDKIEKNVKKNSSTQHEKTLGSVSVVITCYNLGEYLIEAINSVKEQSVKPQEIIVIDDGSNDPNTINVINMISIDSDIKLIIQDNQGVSMARNNAAKQARCDYILFLDADDTLHRDFIKYTKRVLDYDRNRNLGFVTTWIKTFGLSKDVWETQGPDYNNEIIRNALSITSLIRREMFDDIGGYSEEMRLGYEDWDFWVSSIEKKYGWTVIKKPLFNYRIRSNSRNKGAIEKDRLLRELMVSRHPGLYLDKILEQVLLVENQKNKVGLLSDEIKQLNSEKNILDKKILIMSNSNRRQIVKQAIFFRDVIDKIVRFSRTKGFITIVTKKMYEFLKNQIIRKR